MVTIDIDIDVVEIFDRTTHTVRLFHLWDGAGDQPVEWWMSHDGRHHAIYRQDAYYDEQLRQRRNTENMICPQDRSQRFVLIGHLVAQIDVKPADYFEVLRSRVRLRDVAEDEK